MLNRWDKFSDFKKVLILSPILGVGTIGTLFILNYLGKVYERYDQRIK